MNYEPKYYCGICGEEILVYLNIPKTFKVKGIDQAYYAHEGCMIKVREAAKVKNWKLLPDGPLKEAYFLACKEEGIKT